jgi:amidase
MMGHYEPPSPNAIAAAARRVGMTLTPEQTAMFARYGAELAYAYRRVDDLEEYVPPPGPGERIFRHPTAAENRFGAWLVKSSIKTGAAGKLSGKRVAVKDTIAVAGLPMSNGTDFLACVPAFDATIVSRVLDAGGEIAGKAVCEFLSYSSGSHTAVSGPVENPVKLGYSSGGSSSGSAALVAAREVDMALGGDQAGSIRIPASHCGLYGLKPTFGRVPYTGAVSSEFVIDHLGPITATVEDNALLLECIAGSDPLDPRTAGTPPPGDYRAAMGKGISGLSIGVVAEGFGHRGSMPEVDATVRRASTEFARLGATVESIAMPWHRDGLAIWLVFAMEGYFGNRIQGNGFGGNYDGLQWSGLNDCIARWRDDPDSLPANLKLGMLMGEDAGSRYRRHYYVKAMNLVQRLREAYDRALSKHDLLLMPTVPAKARPLPAVGAPPETVIELAFENVDNTCPFNLTHHPALTLPCGIADGCPIGMMLVTKPFDEAVLYGAAYAFEQSTDWRRIGPGA